MKRVFRCLCLLVPVTVLLDFSSDVSVSQQIDLISPIEAVHLVEAHVEDLQVTAVNLLQSGGDATYVVEGRNGPNGYSAIVDARVARVMRISRNGEPWYKWRGVTVVGHRGTVKFAPENTIAACKKAIELGADLVEIDIRETKDGELVLMHDATVDRTTDGVGRVSELTLAEIKKLDAGSWFSAEFRGERVPTLREALAAIRGHALPDIDFKAGTPEKLIDILREEGLLGKVTLYCGDWDLLHETLRQNDGFFARPTVPIGLVGLPILIKEFDPPIVNINWDQFSERLVREVHLAGKKSFVNVMGPNDTEFGMLKAIEAAPDYIQTDNLDILLPLLRAKGLHQ